jgi:hypothetical protein
MGDKVVTLSHLGTQELEDLSSTFSSKDMAGLTNQIHRFTNLSSDQTDQMVNVSELLGSKGFDLKRIQNLFASLNIDEGKVASKVLSRFKTSITPVTLKKEGVYRPLMSGYNLKGDKLEIFLPESLEAYADNGLILELLRFRTSVDNVIISRCPGDVKIPDEIRLSQLIMGYVSELLSDQKIAKISYTRSSFYQLGRMLARAKLVQFVCTDRAIPMKFVQVPKRFMGGTTEFQEPESIRTLKSLISGDVELIDTLLKNLASHVYKTQKDRVKNKLDISLFTSFPEFVHMFERRARVQSKKGRGGKITSSFSTIKPTKPTMLTTVANWEKSAIYELYEDPWKDLYILRDEYMSTNPLDRPYNQYVKRISVIIDQEWTNKQVLLRKTSHRLALANLPDSASLWQKLNKVRETLTEFKSLEACDINVLRRYVRAYDILPSGDTIVEGGFRKSWLQAFKDGDLDSKFPDTSRLIRSYTEIIKSDPEGLIPS